MDTLAFSLISLQRPFVQTLLGFRAVDNMLHVLI